jgi:hypothetical protein
MMFRYNECFEMNRILKGRVLSSGLLLGLPYDPEDGSDMSLRSVG